MKNGRYFNFRDICNRNLWDTGYLVKKLQGYGILRPPLMGPQLCCICDVKYDHSKNKKKEMGIEIFVLVFL